MAEDHVANMISWYLVRSLVYNDCQLDPWSRDIARMSQQWLSYRQGMLYRQKFFWENSKNKFISAYCSPNVPRHQLKPSPFLKAESELQLWVSSRGADSSGSSSTIQLFDCGSSRELIEQNSFELQPYSTQNAMYPRSYPVLRPT